MALSFRAMTKNYMATEYISYHTVASYYHRYRLIMSYISMDGNRKDASGYMLASSTCGREMWGGHGRSTHVVSTLRYYPYCVLYVYYGLWEKHGPRVS